MGKPFPLTEVRMTFRLRAGDPGEKYSWECFREGTKSRPLIVRLAGLSFLDVDGLWVSLRATLALPQAGVGSRQELRGTGVAAGWRFTDGHMAWREEERWCQHECHEQDTSCRTASG